VTHHGRAHYDDFLATAYLKATNPDLGLLRVNHDNPGLKLWEKDKNYWLVDIGKKHEPEMHNFDHHQFSRDADPCCSFSLVLKYFQHYDLAVDLWPWLTSLEILDSKGPAALRAYTGIRHDSMTGMNFISPMDTILIDMFSSVGSTPPEIWETTGKMLVGDIMAYQRMLKALEEEVTVSVYKGVTICYFRAIFRGWFKSGTLFAAATRWIKKNRKAGVMIIDDGSGLCALTRIDDHPQVDFRRIDTMPYVEFVHSNGFIAKVATRHWSELMTFCENAIVPPSD
jgi:hypothetical protein